MDYPKLIACMMRFSGEALRKYLGEDLIDQLVSEWESAEYSSLTKKRLAEMILHLNGTAILRNPAFRKDVLFHMEERDIDLIYQEFLYIICSLICDLLVIGFSLMTRAAFATS